MTTLLPNLTPFRLDDVVVAIAARTSGARMDVGAVKFAGEQTLGEWNTSRIGFGLDGLRAFCRDAPVVGFGLAGVMGALALQGVAPGGPPWDLGELASLLAPTRPRGSPAELARSLLADGVDLDGLAANADAARRAFHALTQSAASLRPATLHRLAQLAAWSHSPLASLLAALAASTTASGPPAAAAVDAGGVAGRLERSRPIGAPKPLTPVTDEEVSGLLSGGLFAQFFPRYEPRPEQVAMACAVARAFGLHEDEGPRQLIVEGGTGIGKSIAYLLPAILFAVRNNVRVVVSTNTINLQEQLVAKDIPNLLRVLRSAPGVDVSQFRYAVMKGKANYLCLRRWQALNASDVSPEEASLLSKTLVWAGGTSTGDRTELGLRGRDAALWDRISANGFSICPGAREGACFYRNVRETAAGAHLVVVNHALLLSDLQVDGSILPEFDYLIVDEAHNLEAEATQQFGFHVSPSTLDELVERLLATTRGLTQAVRASALGDDRKQAVGSASDDAQLAAYHVRDKAGELAARLTAVAADHAGRSGDARDLWITPAIRAQPSWSTLDIAWDNFEHAAMDAAARAEAVWTQTESLSADVVPGLEVVRGDLAEWLADQREVRGRVASFVSKPDEAMVYWLSTGPDGRSGQGVAMSAAPLAVGPRLSAELFATRRTTILTSATLTSAKSFAHVRERLGLSDAEELALGSPFDYRRAALLAVPTDVPEPTSPDYASALGRIVGTLAERANGHTLALFTSHAALRQTAGLLREAGLGLPILTQGVDGNPQQLLQRFQREPEAVLLGTASFWEGVDVADGALKVLVVTRLPFNVPTEPVFAARSAQYEQPFFEYAVPQAVLRFRQGFGRLIRNKDDFGAVVVLDSRIHTKGYGRIFIASLPPATVVKGPAHQVLARVSAWLERP